MTNLRYIISSYKTLLNLKANLKSPIFTGTVGGLTSTMVGLGNVTNESKATMFASPTFTGTVIGVTKGHVGLGNADNTSDINKPVSTAQQTSLDLKANIASPTFTGVPVAPTASVNTNTTQVATTAYVQTELTDLIGGAPGTLDTLNELAAAINNDASYASTLTTALSTKAPLASPTFTGIVAIPNVANLETAVVANTAKVSNIVQTTVSGNAGSATVLQTARTINGVAFDGSGDINITASSNAGTLTGTTLNATVTGSSLTSVGTLGNLTVSAPIAGSVTGNAGTATKLATARTINGVSFDGSAPITITANANLAGNLLTAVPSGALFTDTNTVYTHPGYTALNPTLSGALVLSTLTTNSIGSVTAATTRTLTLGDLGYTGATNANYITNNNQLTNGAGYITGVTNISGNAATATYATTAGSATDSTKLPLAGGTMSGNLDLSGYANPHITLTTTGGSYSYLELYDGSSYGYVIKNETSSTSNSVLPGSLYLYTDSSKATQIVHSGTSNAAFLSGGDVYIRGQVYVGGNGASTGTQLVYNSGTWGINITGNAATAGSLSSMNISQFTNNSGYLTSLPSHTHDDRYFFDYGFTTGYPGTEASGMPGNRSAFTYSNGAPLTGCIAHFGAAGYGIQLNGDYGGDSFSMRSRNGDNATWRPWKRLLTDYNYTNYSPSLTGSGASGTWGINITGNAAYVNRVANYTWNNSTLPTGYNSGIETSFVSSAEGWPNYGVVLSVMGRVPTDPGGNFQLYMGHGTNYGGLGLRVRSISQTNNLWTSWKILLDETNYSSYALPLSGGTMSGPIRRNSHSTGFLEGSYNTVGGNSQYTNPIYTIGSSYYPTDSSLQSMYGIGYSHPNFWGSGKTSGWGMYVCEGGTINATIGGGSTTIWAQNDIVGNGNMQIAGTFTALGYTSIGTTNKVRPLEVAGDLAIIRITDSNTDGVGSISYLEWYDSNSRLGYIGFANGGNNHLIIKNDDATSNGAITFWTGSTEKVRISHLGYVGIGTTNPTYQLQLSTNSAAKPSSSSWTISSDSRVKENIRDYTTGLEAILKINPKWYDYNGKAGFDKVKDNIGVIAQDMIDIMPETIKTYKAKLNEEDEEDTELYNYDGHAVTFALINAVKELQAQIKELKKQINN